VKIVFVKDVNFLMMEKEKRVIVPACIVDIVMEQLYHAHLIFKMIEEKYLQVFCKPERGNLW